MSKWFIYRPAFFPASWTHSQAVWTQTGSPTLRTLTVPSLHTSTWTERSRDPSYRGLAPWHRNVLRGDLGLVFFARSFSGREWALEPHFGPLPFFSSLLPSLRSPVRDQPLPLLGLPLAYHEPGP